MSTNNRTDLPTPSAPNFEQRLRETVMTYLGKQGDPLDRGLTVRDLVANGVLKLGAGWKGGSGLVPLVPGTALEVPTEEIDLTPPPTPTGFAVDSAISHVFIEHDAPLYRQGHGHKQTRVYGINPTEDKPNPVFADAIELGQFAGQVWAMPSNPSTTWHLWIKWETNDGVLSVDPAGGTNGLVVRTGEDVGLLLDALTGAITQGQLYQDLSNRIDLIDGNHPGSVNDRIQSAVLDESGARTLADTTLAAAVQFVGNDAAVAGAALLEEKGAREVAESAIAATLQFVGNDAAVAGAALLEEKGAREVAEGIIGSAVQQIFGDGLATRNALSVEQETRLTETESLASQVTTLVAQTGDNRAGLQVVQEAFADGSEALARQLTTLVAEAGANAAALMVEQETRADATSALASQVTSLAAATEAGAAALQVEQEARSDALGSLASQVTTLTAETGGNSAALQVEQEARADSDSATASQLATLAAATGDNLAALTVEQLVRTDESSALASQVVALAAETGSNSAGLKVEQETRSDELGAVASQITGLVAEAGANAAALMVEQETRADATSALASQVTSLAAATEAGAAALLVEQEARSDALGSLASQVITLTTETGSNAAAIQVEQDARTDALGSIASQVTTLAAESGDNLAALLVEQQVRTDESSSLASQMVALSAETGSNSAGLKVEQQTRADEAGAIASQVTGLVVEAGANAAALMVEQETRADATSALASQVTSMAAEVGSNSAGLKVEQETRASETEAVVRQVELLVAKTGDNIAAITETKDTLTTETSALASAVAGLAVAVGDASAGILTTQQATADANGSLAAQLASLAASTGANSAAITTDTKVQTDALSAVAGEVRTLAVASGSNTAAIQNESQVRATETGDLFAKYTVKVDIAGHVSGYGLASTGNTAAAFSEFGILADRFFISPPATSGSSAPTADLYAGRVWVDTSATPSVTKYYTGSSWSTTPQALPFIVQTSPTKVDDIDIPAGVYMNAAYIKNGTITNAKIGKAAIDDAKIANLSASKITSGEIAVGREIKSSGFIANSDSTAGAGWRIHGNGNAEFSNATVRGTVYATNGQFWGTLLGGAATAFNSGLGFYAGGGSTGDGANYRWRVGNPTGARIQWTGSAVEVYNASNTLAFSSGGIAWNYVTGKPTFGDLAAKDSLGYTDITGTKPPSDADKTSNNVAKGIAGQGAFATLGKLTKNNISTYIETAAITNAYIGNAEISTLKLAGNAVTVPQIATSGELITGDLSWKNVIETSITLDSSGTVMANFACKQGFFSFPNAWLFKMYIDGTVVFEVGGTSGIDSIAMVGAKSIIVPEESTKTVTVKVIWNSNSEVQVHNRSLWVMGAKR